MNEGLSNAAIKRIGVSFVESMGIVRTKTLMRLLEHYSEYKTERVWITYIYRLIQSSDLVYLQRGGRGAASIVGTSDVKVQPLMEVRYAHELRVAEVAVEFIRQGFEWIPPIKTRHGAHKVADGSAWLGDVCVDIEVEISPKNQRHWAAAIDRYRKKQETTDLGVVYVFGNDGLRRSFRTSMAEKDTPGWWHLGLNNGRGLHERQDADAAIAHKVKQAVINGEIRATKTNTEEQLTAAETAPARSTDAVENPPTRVETELERMRRELMERRRQKQQKAEQEQD